jgi:hypothetical protein
MDIKIEPNVCFGWVQKLFTFLLPSTELYRISHRLDIEVEHIFPPFI